MSIGKSLALRGVYVFTILISHMGKRRYGNVYRPEHPEHSLPSRRVWSWNKH